MLRGFLALGYGIGDIDGAIDIAPEMTFDNTNDLDVARPKAPRSTWKLRSIGESIADRRMIFRDERKRKSVGETFAVLFLCG